MMEAFHSFLKNSPMMAYLAMMAPRLVELHRALKETGSLYLHCDDVASHYLKLLLDGIFGARFFRTEIIWKRTTAHGNARQNFGVITDAIFGYSRGEEPKFNRLFVDYDPEYLRTKYRHVDQAGRRYRLDNLRNPGYRPNLIYDYKGFKPHPNGWAITKEKMEQWDAEGRIELPKKADGRIQLRRFLDEQPGLPVTNLWDDIPAINSQAQERLGYPTQKPQALLERIISASSNPGDVVLDL